MRNDKYIPALSYNALTPFYDTVVGLTTREKLFKKALVEHARIRANHRVLDLACGTGTLTILLKEAVPEAEIIGVDGDPKILELAKKKREKGMLKLGLMKECRLICPMLTSLSTAWYRAFSFII